MQMYEHLVVEAITTLAECWKNQASGYSLWSGIIRLPQISLVPDITNMLGVCQITWKQ